MFLFPHAHVHSKHHIDYSTPFLRWGLHFRFLMKVLQEDIPDWSELVPEFATLGFANPNLASNRKSLRYSFEAPSLCQWGSHHWLGTYCIQQFGFPSMVITWSTWTRSSFSRKSDREGQGNRKVYELQGELFGEMKVTCQSCNKQRNHVWFIPSRALHCWTNSGSVLRSLSPDSQPNRNYTENGNHGWS